MYDELGRMWKETVVAYYKVLSILCVEELRKVMKCLSQDSSPLGRE